MGLDKAVGCLNDRPVLPARRRGHDRDESKWAAPAELPGRPGQTHVAVKDLLRCGRARPGDIVGPGVQHDRPGMAGQDDPFSIVTTSAILEPPKPRLITGRGAMSCSRLDQKVMLELPVNRMAPAGAGWRRSRASNRRMLASQACGSPRMERSIPENILKLSRNFSLIFWTRLTGNPFPIFW